MVLRLVPGQTPVPLLTSVPCVTLRSFVPGQTLDRIIEYALKDVGVHILICSALYTDASGERKYFRKFFKFQVNNPLSMKSKTHTLAGSNEVPAEAPAHFTSLQEPAAAECHMPRTSIHTFPWPRVTCPLWQQVVSPERRKGKSNGRNHRNATTPDRDLPPVR